MIRSSWTTSRTVTESRSCAPTSGSPCGRAIVVRYEDLHRDPVAALDPRHQQIEPVDPARIEQAIEACSVDNMRKMSKKMSQHVRTAKVGDSRDKLGEPHLRIFREKYSDLLTSLGYEVR